MGVPVWVVEPEWIVSDLIASFIYQAADDWNILSDEVKNIFVTF